MDQDNRVVVLIDMDCFYCQVEEKLDPKLKGKPIAVVQYNPWKGGGIIAVNYVARSRGVTRHMRGDEAREKCPDIVLPSVPCLRGKADISKYRDAGKEVARVLQRFTPLLERASIDEAYLDITQPVEERLKTQTVEYITAEMVPNTFALGYSGIDEFISEVRAGGSDCIEFDYEHARRLLAGAAVVSEIRAAVYEETGYRCSAGIAHNKILAKLVCGMNKPDKQTVLPKHCVNLLFRTLPVKKVKHLGGKFGYTVCDVLKITTMGELHSFTEKELQAKFDEKNGTWLYNIARGIDHEPVQARFNPKSIGCCKQLRGKSALRDLDSLRKWLTDLGDEIEDRLEADALESNRTPKQMVVSFTTQLPDGRDSSSSRSYNFVPDDELCGELFSGKALELVMETVEGVKVKDGEPNRKLRAPIKFLGISVGKFEDNTETKKTRKILDYFGAGPSNANKTENNTRNNKIIDVETKKNDGKDYIMQKFLHGADKNQSFKSNDEKINEINISRVDNHEHKLAESTLDKQESFFAKFLNKGPHMNVIKSEVEHEENTRNEPVRPATPVCNIVNCGEDSNDTNYTGSTIDKEINKSIALFDDDPQDIARVRSIRDLLTSTVKKDVIEQSDSEECEEKESFNIKEPDKCNKKVLDAVQDFECPECKKIVPISKFDEHSDYHLALRLREEERQRVRKEVKEAKEKKATSKPVTINEEVKRRKVEDQKNESVASIASFLVKLEDNVPTEMCNECGKKIAVEKLTEHLDFHEAQKLSRQLNGKEPPMPFSSHSVKRKRKTVSPIKRTKLPCTSRSIDSFFR